MRLLFFQSLRNGGTYNKEISVLILNQKIHNHIGNSLVFTLIAKILVVYKNIYHIFKLTYRKNTPFIMTLYLHQYLNTSEQLYSGDSFII